MNQPLSPGPNRWCPGEFTIQARRSDATFEHIPPVTTHYPAPVRDRARQVMLSLLRIGRTCIPQAHRLLVRPAKPIAIGWPQVEDRSGLAKGLELVVADGDRA